jgi:hypothetical protein
VEVAVSFQTNWLIRSAGISTSAALVDEISERASAVFADVAAAAQ